VFNVDQYAYSNRLRVVHPGEKFTFAILTMVICLGSPSMVTPLVIVFLMAGTVIFRAGIPWRIYLKLMSLPASFLVIGVATVALSISRHPQNMLYGITLGGVAIGVAADDLGTAANLFCKSLGAVSCLYFLSLTTPMVEFMLVLRRLGLPSLLIELMSLIYRFIFVLLKTADDIYTAQSSRLGYISCKRSYLSLGQLAANLFIKAYTSSQILYTTLSSRCYTGELKVLETHYPVSRKNIIVMAIVDLLLALITLSDGGGIFGKIHN